MSDGSAANVNNLHLMPPQTLTRGEVAELLETSKSTVRRMERDGVLQPVRDARGWNVFERAQVLQLQAQRVHGDASQHEGRVAARAFELFDEGQNAACAVKQLELPPDQAEQLYRAWKRLNASERGVFVSEAAWAQLVEGWLAIPDSAGSDLHRLQRLPLELPADEQGLVRAVARAHDWATARLQRHKPYAPASSTHSPLELASGLHAWLQARMAEAGEGEFMQLHGVLKSERRIEVKTWGELDPAEARKLAHRVVETAHEWRRKVHGPTGEGVAGDGEGGDASPKGKRGKAPAVACFVLSLSSKRGTQSSMAFRLPGR